FGSAINVYANRKDGSANPADAAQITAGTISGNKVFRFFHGAGVQMLVGTSGSGPANAIASSGNPFIIQDNIITGIGGGLSGIGTNGVAVTVGEQSTGYFNIGSSGHHNIITNVADDGVACCMFGQGTTKCVMSNNIINANNAANSPAIN